MLPTFAALSAFASTKVAQIPDTWKVYPSEIAFVFLQLAIFSAT